MVLLLVNYPRAGSFLFVALVAFQGPGEIQSMIHGTGKFLKSLAGGVIKKMA